MAAKQKILPMVDVARHCLIAGFTGWRSAIVTAVLQVEAGIYVPGQQGLFCDVWSVNLNTHREPEHPSYLSLDLGICQWNTWYWIDSPLVRPADKMTVREMLTPESAIAKMFHVTKGGKDEHLALWNGFKSNAHTKYITAARAAVREAGGTA